MKKIVRLTESDLTRLVKRVINEERTNEKYWNEFKKWAIKTGQVEIYFEYNKDGEREERAIVKGRLPLLYFNDGSSLSVQISKHDGWEGISVRDGEYGTDEEEKELSDNETEYEGDGEGFYGNVPGGAIARIIKKRKGIEE
jgi:hypothetical protein